MKNLKQKLIEVSKSIGYLQKDKTNKMQGYKYLSEAMIKKTIKAQFEEQGIIFNYSTNDVSQYEISQTHKGTKQFCTIVKGIYSFIDVDSEERIDGSWSGSGTDTGDKGLYKAITGGVKYILSTNFLIPTGDDPENDNGNGKGETTGSKRKATTPKVKVNKDLELKKELLKKHGGDKVKAKAEYDEIQQAELEGREIEAEFNKKYKGDK